jgi:hypothetical protein
MHETLVVVDLWFIRNGKRNVRLIARRRLWRTGYVLMLKEMLFLENTNPLCGVPGTIAGVLQSMQN